MTTSLCDLNLQAPEYKGEVPTVPWHTGTVPSAGYFDIRIIIFDNYISISNELKF
jgi:hypothetical protein